ncbi:MAG: glycosyltransferase family 39 protein [Patescibacteria group bacterium]
MKITKFWIFLAILILGIFLRVWELNKYPVHFGHDEITQLYDAISIAQTGRDIYGNFLPTIFPSIGDFKPPFYTYATALVYLLAGNHEWTIRVVGVVFGILIIPAVFWFTKSLTKNSRLALWASFFTAISPAEIFFSRKSFENGIGIFFTLIAFVCLFNSLGKGKRWLYLVALFSALGMYTYFSHVIIIPLMVAVFILIFRKQFSFKPKELLPPLLLWIFLIVPLVLIFLINPGSRYRSQTVFITQDINLGKQLEFVNGPLYFKVIGDFIFNRYLNQFDPTYLFVNGLNLTNQGPLNIGPLLFVQLPFLSLGVLFFIQRPFLRKEGKLIASLIALGTLPSGLTFEPYSPHRIVIAFTFLNIVTGVGSYWFWQKLKDSRSFKLASIIFLVLLTCNVIYFLHVYFVNYPFEKSQYLQYPFKQVSEFAWSKSNDFDQIVLDPLFGEDAPRIGVGAHYYLAYFGNYPPSKFQKEYKIGDKDRELSFEKFSIRKIEWGKDYNLKNTLLIGSPWSLPIQDIEKDKIIRVFYFYNKRPAFYGVKL